MPCNAPFKLCAGNTGPKTISHSLLTSERTSCFSLPPSLRDNVVSLLAGKALSAIRFCINLCKAGFNQHSPALRTIPCYIRMAKKESKQQAKPAAVNMVFIAVCTLWLSGLKRVYRLRPKCRDKIGAPECVALRTLAAVYLLAEKLSKVSRPSALTPRFRPDDRQTRYQTAFVPWGDTEVPENPKASSELLSRVW